LRQKFESQSSYPPPKWPPKLRKHGWGHSNPHCFLRASSGSHFPIFFTCLSYFWLNGEFQPKIKKINQRRWNAYGLNILFGHYDFVVWKPLVDLSIGIKAKRLLHCSHWAPKGALYLSHEPLTETLIALTYHLKGRSIVLISFLKETSNVALYSHKNDIRLRYPLHSPITIRHHLSLMNHLKLIFIAHTSLY